MKIHPLYQLLQRLEDATIFFTISRHRPDTILVSITVPGERIEIDVFDDGHMEVSRFKGNESIVGNSDLVNDIIKKYKE
ncbi:MAG: hypothetical protein WC637_04435 [Victivallales bacterium]|jgi:hypothetical protein